ncbi:MAG: hypothetical protein ACLUKN_05575 [Bacilli bacterium]
MVLNNICKGDKEFGAEMVIQNCDVLSLHTYNHSSQFNRTPEAWYKRMLKSAWKS